MAVEHEQRDVATMLWQSQMNLLQKYVPEQGLDDDVILYGGDLYICEQGLSDEPQSPANPAKPASGIFRETMTLQFIDLSKAMDMQHDASCEWRHARKPFAKVETIRFGYDD